MGDLENIFGAALSGVIVNAWVLGLIYILSYQYYTNFPRDGKGTKLLVAWMWFLQTFNGVIVSKTIYHYLVTSFGIYENLKASNWEWSLYPGLSTIAAFSAQAYYARRVHILSKSYILSGVILLFAFCQLGFGLTAMSEIFATPVFEAFASIRWVCLARLSFAAASDILIAIAQVVYLHRHKTEYTATNRIVNTLVSYIIGTGLLTSIIDIVALATFAALGFNFVFIFLSFPTGAVYTISFLVNLDARRAFFKPENLVISNSFSIEFGRPNPPAGAVVGKKERNMNQQLRNEIASA